MLQLKEFYKLWQHLGLFLVTRSDRISQLVSLYWIMPKIKTNNLQASVNKETLKVNECHMSLRSEILEQVYVCFRRKLLRWKSNGICEGMRIRRHKLVLTSRCEQDNLTCFSARMTHLCIGALRATRSCRFAYPFSTCSETILRTVLTTTYFVTWLLIRIIRCAVHMQM